MANTAETIDEYLDALDPVQRQALERIRSLVTRLVPEVTERISYRMPTLMYEGRALVYFTASKKRSSPVEWCNGVSSRSDRITRLTRAGAP